MLDSRWASIDAFAENNRDNILRDITRLVAVPSVEGTPEPGAPFGKGPKAALDKALEIAAVRSPGLVFLLYRNHSFRTLTQRNVSYRAKNCSFIRPTLSENRSDIVS